MRKACLAICMRKMPGANSTVVRLDLVVAHVQGLLDPHGSSTWVFRDAMERSAGVCGPGITTNPTPMASHNGMGRDRALSVS